MKTHGQVVLALGDDVSTDIIYPGRFMATVLPTETPAFAFFQEREPLDPDPAAEPRHLRHPLDRT